MAHSLGLPQAARKSQLLLSTSIFNILKYLIPVHHWDLAMLWKQWDIFGFLSYKQGEQRAFASLTQQVTWSCWKNWFQEPPCSEGRSALHVYFLLIFVLHNLVLPFFCAKRWFHSLSPLWECLMLSLMSVAGEWAWTCCHGACTDRAASSSHPLLPQMPTEAFNLPLSSQHCHFSDFKRAWSAHKVQLPAFILAALNKLSISFWSIQPRAWNCFTEVRKELQTSPEPAASFYSLLPVVPASQNNLPSPSSPHSWHVKYCLVTEA